MANYIQEEYLLFGRALAMLMYKTASDGKYVKKSFQPEVWRASRGSSRALVHPAAALQGKYSDSYCRVPPSKLPIGQRQLTSESQQQRTPTMPSLLRIADSSIHSTPNKQSSTITTEIEKLSNSYRKHYPCISTYETSA